MFNKLSTKNLFALFVVLLLVVIYLLFFNSGEERTFRRELVSLDTAKVNKIVIYPKDKKNKTIYLSKDSNKWKVKIADNKYAAVPKEKVVNLLNELSKIKPVSLSARDKSKWHDYQVDSTGIRVQAYENDKPALDIVIGRFSYQQPNSIFTYVRLFNDADVYQTEGFLSISFNKSVNDFRNSNIIESNKTKWVKLTYQYPADSSFVLVRSGSRWKIGSQLTDSATTEQLLNNLERITSTDFNDNFMPQKSQAPVYKLIINMSDTSKITVDAYKTSPEDNSQIIIHSSQNPDSFFTLNKELHSRIFLSPKKFMVKSKTK
ncbi:DUF4340 domain-containing protein [Melioribacteraceae bacterium 4301-Me]|uniref:DUF4340 domain-containing protein n=1 Tax=Pyranulibacter aquaticus TaxID=3163344 RepID=UPI003599088C